MIKKKSIILISNIAAMIVIILAVALFLYQSYALTMVKADFIALEGAIKIDENLGADQLKGLDALREENFQSLRYDHPVASEYESGRKNPFEIPAIEAEPNIPAVSGEENGEGEEPASESAALPETQSENFGIPSEQAAGEND